MRAVAAPVPAAPARIVGAKVGAAARRLWVCASRVDNIDNRVWLLDLDSGEQMMEFSLAASASNGACNDFALDATGIVLYAVKSEVTHFSVGQSLETSFEIFVPDINAFDES